MIGIHMGDGAGLGLRKLRIGRAVGEQFRNGRRVGLAESCIERSRGGFEAEEPEVRQGLVQSCFLVVCEKARPDASVPGGTLVSGVWMAKEDGIEMEGVVQEVLPDRNYRVLLDNGHTILAYAAGKMSKFKIRVLEGDRVSVVLSPYDLTRGRVVYRHK